MAGSQDSATDGRSNGDRPSSTKKHILLNAFDMSSGFRHLEISMPRMTLADIC